MGWDNLYPKKGVEITSTQKEPYLGGILDDFIMDYSFPSIRTHFLYAKHDEEIKSGRDLIFVVHGHGSSSYKVMGLDNPDYMQEAGKVWFEDGFDILALDATSLTAASDYLNSQLILYGVQIYGLWSRSVCDIVSGLGLKDKYSHIYLYGLSNGGIIADFASVLCPEQFDKVVIGDIIEDWSAAAKKHLTLFRD